MIIFLFGKDTYQSRQKLNEIIEEYKKIHQTGLNLKLFDFKKQTFSEFKEAIQLSSMFKEKKLFIFKNSFLNVDFQKEFIDFGKNLILNKSDDIIVFFEAGEVDKRKSLLKFLKKYAKVQEFKPLGQGKLNKWVKGEFERQKTEISPTAQSLLIEFVGNDLWQMANEIKKLASYKKGKAIEKEDVELLVKPKIETDIFKTIDAIASKNKKQALILIHKHLEKGDKPLYLLSMINFQFRNLLLIKSLNGASITRINEISRELGIHPYVVRKILWQTEKFSLEQLKKIFQKIFQTDLQIKTGQLNPEIALDLLITEI